MVPSPILHVLKLNTLLRNAGTAAVCWAATHSVLAGGSCGSGTVMMGVPRVLVEEDVVVMVRVRMLSICAVTWRRGRCLVSCIVMTGICGAVLSCTLNVKNKQNSIS